MSYFFWFTMGFLCAIAVVIIFRRGSEHIKYKTPLLEILNYAKDEKLEFEKRISDIAYFNGYKDLTILYNVRKKNISVFDGDNCVIVTPNKYKNIENDIIDTLDSNYYHEIHKDISVLNGVVYSNNLLDSQQQIPYQSPPHKVDNEKSKAMVEFVLEEDEENEIDSENLNMDDILYKMKKFGIDSLTEEEKEFIKDSGNWNI